MPCCSRPAHHIPGEKASDSVIAKTDEGHQRIEQAFQKYFFRSSELVPSKEDKKAIEDDKHEFEIIVCHGNVIRYFLCRYVCVLLVT
jgi:serine/threonine-protein phosphatase PGAM5